MSLFDVLSKGFCSKKRESNEILSQEEYKDKFLHGDEYIKRELYDEYISRRLSEEFGLKYNEKIKKWHSEWSANRRFVVELCYPRGNHIYLRWGYNYDIIHFIRREMLDFTAFPVFFVSNLLLVQRKKYYFNRATVSRNCSIVL